MKSLLALLFVSSLVSQAAAGDIRLIAVGQVIGTDPIAPTGNLAGVAAGSPFEMVVEVFDTPTILGVGARSYPIDAAAGGVTVGPVSFSYDPPTEELVVLKGFLSGDQLSVPVELAGSGGLIAAVLLSDATGMTLATEDLIQLIGTTYTPSPASLVAGITASSGAATPTVLVLLSEIRIEGGGGGTGGPGGPYCTAVPNSIGSGAQLFPVGSTVAADNGLSLTVTGLPSNRFGFFLNSQAQGFVSQPGGSQGNLCLGGSIGRYSGAGQIRNSGPAGEFSLALNLNATPTPGGLVSIQAGQTWYFQAWYRDTVAGAASSNFSNGYRVPFQ